LGKDGRVGRAPNTHASMNIFVLHRSPVISAQMACDKHVVKMILETAQMLSTVARDKHGILGSVKYLDKEGNVKTRERPLISALGEYSGMWEHERNPNVYWDVHHKHPCTTWTGENSANWAWLCKHGIALAKEYTFRYGKTHSSETVIRTIYRKRLGPKGIIWLTGQTPFAQAMPDQYKNSDPVKAYRDYYIGEKHEFARWTKRDTPKWWREAVL